MTALAVLGVVFTVSLRAETRDQPPTEALAAQEANVSMTAERHIVLAETYEQVAAVKRSKAEALRRKGAAEYKRAARGLPNKTGREFPWLAKIRKVYDDSTREAQAPAEEAERHAEYHRFRALESEGRRAPACVRSRRAGDGLVTSPRHAAELAATTGVQSCGRLAQAEGPF